MWQEMASATSMTSYLYCGAAFSSGSGLANLQDGQHPNVAGYEALGQCLQPLVSQYIDGSSPSWSSSSPGTSSSSSSSSSSNNNTGNNSGGSSNGGGSSSGNNAGSSSNGSGSGGNGR